MVSASILVFLSVFFPVSRIFWRFPFVFPPVSFRFPSRYASLYSRRAGGVRGRCHLARTDQTRIAKENPTITIVGTMRRMSTAFWAVLRRPLFCTFVYLTDSGENAMAKLRRVYCNSVALANLVQKPPGFQPQRDKNSPQLSTLNKKREPQIIN